MPRIPRRFESPYGNRPNRGVGSKEPELFLERSMAFPLPLLLGIDAIICSSIHITAIAYIAMVYAHEDVKVDINPSKYKRLSSTQG